MEKHFTLSDDKFEQQFINLELDPAIFTHTSHLRLAWINIQKYGIEDAEKNIQKYLMKFVENVGAKDKYNKTLTIAATKAVYHFISKSKSENFIDFIDEFPRLQNHFKDLMASHYSLDIYNSEKAKSEYLEPDLLPFS